MSHGRTRLVALLVAGVAAVALLLAQAPTATAGPGAADQGRCRPATRGAVCDPNLAVTVIGQGTVTSNPVGIVCRATSPVRAHRVPAGCLTSYVGGIAVVLTAEADAGYRRTGWTGCDSVVLGDCHVTMAGDRAVTATFAPVSYAVSTQVVGRGTITSDPGEIDCRTGGAARAARLAREICYDTFDSGDTVVLTATPDDGQRFAGWSTPTPGRGRAEPPTCSGVAPTCTLTMTDDALVRATFVEEPVADRTMLQVRTTGDGAGVVTSNPAGIDCGAACWFGAERGSVVTLTATPAAGSTFAGFTGAGCSTSPCTVTMSESLLVTAKFAAAPAPDTTAPDTRITFTPTNPSNDHSWFRFTATETGATFQCSLDGAPGVDCTSPVDYPCLAPGRHTFRVWATDPAGNADVTPADHRFTVRAGRHC